MLSSPDARMPRDHKTPLIKKIAKQACITYRVLKSSADLADSQSELIPLLTAVWAADLKIAPSEKQAVLRGGGAPEPPGHLHAHLRDGEKTHLYEISYLSDETFPRVLHM
ncbi:unnamed protein product [Pleuronectes platessa]|uniref:Uncharacterized protein n=1 Tax=Pleuronectes platessa TaxID=8262 RepID=A0A9N7Y7V8_PLEPL|nr:unnamed protein product [Pleuronectes platessa]